MSHVPHAFLVAPLLLLGCATAEVAPASGSRRWLSASEAYRAAAAQPEGASGSFEIPVQCIGQGTGPLEGHFFLYTSKDPRTSGTVVLQLPPDVVQDLRASRRVEPLTDLQGRLVRVTGTAKLKPLGPGPAGAGTGDAQAWILATSPDQIVVLKTFSPAHLPDYVPREHRN
jgi:hypothetical protein